ncbi:hypothetical protein D9M69_360500 [compost metagenome]
MAPWPSAPKLSATEPAPAPVTTLPFTVPPSLTVALSARAVGTSSTISMTICAGAEVELPSETLRVKTSLSAPGPSVVGAVSS